MNVTDIDDKIITRAGQRDLDPIDVARQFETEFFADMKWLGNDAVDVVARSHDYVEEVISQVVRLRDKGAVYRTDEGWYFDLSVLENQNGKLSGRDFNTDESQSRVSNSLKRNSGDFVVWKFVQPGEPSWESDELGAGRPGWHIEDTAITEKVFGEQYDIHGGAMDLVFPHHEAEIIQMETVSGKTPLVNYWLHTGLLQIDGKKMAKSTGNFITIRSLVDEWDYRTVRYFFISKHYRSSIDITEEGFEESASARSRVESFYRELSDTVEDERRTEEVAAMRDEFFSKLADDFNSPDALSTLYTFIHNAYKTGVSSYGKETKAVLQEINSLYDTFVFRQDEDEQIQQLVETRQKLRAEKKYEEADDIRTEINQLGYTLEDTSNGVRWFKTA